MLRLPGGPMVVAGGCELGCEDVRRPPPWSYAQQCVRIGDCKLNRGGTSAKITVDYGMFEGAISLQGDYEVRDLWAQKPLPDTQKTASGFAAQVASHDIALFKLTPKSRSH